MCLRCCCFFLTLYHGKSPSTTIWENMFTCSKLAGSNDGVELVNVEG